MATLCFRLRPRNGLSNTRLFIARGYELTQFSDANGCVILPYDVSRPWTRQAMLETERFQTAHGWGVREKLDRMHRYHLDDDAELASSLILVDRIAPCATASHCSPYAGRRVDFDEIPCFYGQTVVPPYPRYIREDGAGDFDWPAVAA